MIGGKTEMNPFYRGKPRYPFEEDKPGERVDFLLRKRVIYYIVLVSRMYYRKEKR
jgi:hypothetical protein